MSVLAGCGLRVSELCNLTIRLYDTTGEQALVRIRDAKGGKGRTVPVPRETVAEIDRYLAERADRTGGSPMLEVSAKARLFVTNAGQPVSQQFIDVLLRRLCVRARIGQPDGAMAHALRHHYGTQLALAACRYR